MIGAATSNLLKYTVVLRQNPPAPVSFTSTASSQDFTLFGMPPKHVVCGIKIDVPVAFAVAVGSPSASITVGANPTTVNGPSTWVRNFFVPTYDLTVSASQYFSPFAAFTLDPYDVTATVSTSMISQVANFTAGEVHITFLYQPL